MEDNKPAAEGLIASPVSQLDVIARIKELQTYAVNVNGSEFGGLIHRGDVLKLLAEVSSPARPQLDELFRDLEIALYGKADNTWEVGRMRAVEAVLRKAIEGAVSAAPQTHSLSCPTNGQNLGGYRCECDEVSAAPPALPKDHLTGSIIFDPHELEETRFYNLLTAKMDNLRDALIRERRHMLYGE